MRRRFQALSRPGLDSETVGLRPSSAREMGLRRGEPLWIESSEQQPRRIHVSGWRAEPNLGPDGCLMAPEMLARLGMDAMGYVLLSSARLPQPDFFLFCWSYQEFDQEPRPEDLLVVLDVSGSMAGAPLRSARRALQAFVERRRERRRELGLDDRLGLLTFGGEGEEGVQLACPPAADNDQAFLSAVERTQADGLTPLGAALRKAAGLLEQAPDDDGSPRRRRLVLLSDGYPCPEDPSLMSLIDELARQEVRVAAVGVGDGFDRRLLSELAARTGGPFLEVRQVRELALLLEELT